ncbi:hypothetical protein AMTRI_Chr13g89190 [Amborella trichopoda]
MDANKIKVVNSAPLSILGIARKTVNLVIIPLDNFEAILENEFLTVAKDSAVPHLGVVAIMEEISPCMVPVVWIEKRKTLSALCVAAEG